MRAKRTTSPSRRRRDDLTFYCTWFCPFAQRAWIALEEKRVAYDYVSHACGSHLHIPRPC